TYNQGVSDCSWRKRAFSYDSQLKATTKEMTKKMNERQDLTWRQLTKDILNAQLLEHPDKAMEIQTLGLYAWALYCDLKINGTEIKFARDLFENRATDNQWTNDSPDDVGFLSAKL